MKGRGMKLLFVHERWGAFGGAETNLQSAAGELRNRGHQLGILHGPGTGQGEKEWSETFSTRAALWPKGPVAVQNMLREFRPDLVYVHKMGDLAVLDSLLASRVPLVRMVHDHDVYCMRSYKYDPFTRAICTRPASPYCIFPCGACVARARGRDFPFKWVSYAAKRKEIRLNQQFNCLIVATGYMKGELLRNGFKKEKIKIHPPVPVNLSSSQGAAPETPSKTVRNRILYVGQIIRGKGVDVLLESLAQIRIPFECLILGEGNHRSFCERLSRRLGLQDRVHFLGFVSQNELPSYFTEANLMVLSSVWPEPFGAAGLEGMRFGLPVVAFDAGGISEWLIDGENGFLVPWMDRTTFATRVQQLLMDKGIARQMGQRGARLVSERFDFSDYVTALERTFEEVQSEAGKRAGVSA